jgi:hypothetical protein
MTVANTTLAAKAITASTTLSVTGVTTVQAGTAAAPAITTTGDTNTGIFFPAADTIAFTEGGAEAMRIDSSGNVGIGGTPASGHKLNIIGTAATTFGAWGVTGTTTAGAYAQFVNTGNTTIIGVESSAGASLCGGTSAYASIFGTSSAAPVQFVTNNNTRATIDSSGNLLVGVTATTTISGVATTHTVSRSTADSSWNFSVMNTASSGGPRGLAVNYSAQTPNNTGSECLFARDSTSNRFLLYSNGGIANYSANNANLSDRREKTNFAPAKSYLDVICNIPVQTFNYIDQNQKDDDGLTLGVVAQDVQTVAPELVLESNWGTEDEPKMRLSIYQTDLQYALMKCIQEQQALITALTARITALENK